MRKQLCVRCTGLSTLIKKPPSKQELSESLAQDIQRYLKKGKNIHQVPKGVSSRDGMTYPLKPETWQMQKSSQERTYIPEVVDALEKRRTTEKPASRSKPKSSRPRKRLIYDDFGEPLRWVWVED